MKTFAITVEIILSSLLCVEIIHLTVSLYLMWFFWSLLPGLCPDEQRDFSVWTASGSVQHGELSSHPLLSQWADDSQV